MKKILRYDIVLLVIYIFMHFLFLFKCVCFSKNFYISNTKEFKESLKKVDNGDKIILKTGIYNGNFYINKSLIIKSDGFVVLTSGGYGNILTIKAPDVKIYGVYFYNSGKDLSKKNACIFIDESNSIIFNSFFSECCFGIWVNDSFYTYIINNIFIGSSESLLNNRGNTIQLYKNNSSIINNNFIIGGRDGIYISNSKDVSINKNIFSNVRFGIHYMFSNVCNVSSNMLNESLIGIAVMYSKYVDLINNFLCFNYNYGLFFRDVLYSKATRNKIIYNSIGLLIGNSYYNDIINNDIIKNQIGMKLYSGSDENLVYDNNCITNKLQVQFLDNKKITWNSKKTGNFWSHYLGWDFNMDNIGDKKFFVTNINDWLIYYYPILTIIFNSPAFILLQKIENQFPAFRKNFIIDNYPLMRPIIW